MKNPPAWVIHSKTWFWWLCWVAALRNCNSEGAARVGLSVPCLQEPFLTCGHFENRTLFGGNLGCVVHSGLVGARLYLSMFLFLYSWPSLRAFRISSELSTSLLSSFAVSSSLNPRNTVVDIIGGLGVKLCSSPSSATC